MSDNDALPFEEFAADSRVQEAELFDYGPSNLGEDPFQFVESPQRAVADPAEVSRLRSLHEDLIEAIHTAVNLTVRDDLMAELRSVRERIVELVGSADGLDPLPSDHTAQHAGTGSWDATSGQGPIGGGALVPVPVPGYDPESASRRMSGLATRQLVPLVLAAVAGIALLGFALFGGGDDEVADETALELSEAPDPAGATTSGAALTAVRSAITGMGYDSISADERNGVVYLSGSVSDEASRNQLISAARAVAAGTAVEADALVVASEAVDRPAAASLQRELDRLLGATPIVFAAGEVTLSERHQRILNNVVPALLDNAGLTVEVVGFTDGAGDADVNLRLSQSRAQNVVAYLQSQGVPSSQLQSRAAGETGSSGSADLQSLERRVELQVRQPGRSITPGADQELGIALIAPSAANDLSATQSMADALAKLADDNDSPLPVSVRIVDNVIDSAAAEELMIEQAESGTRLIVAHGLQFGAAVASVARAYPSVVFAWGTGSDTFGLPNVYAYNAAAEEGGFVLGSLAALLTSSGTVGFVGPLEAGDASRYANGFRAGATAQRPGTTVAVDFTGSFSEVALAAEAARAQIDNGADALTGTSPLVVGAVDAAVQANVIWFGNESDQTPLAPSQVVASQVYDWSVVLDLVVDEVSSGAPNGRPLTIDMANGGLSIVFNPEFALDPAVKGQIDQLVSDVTTGVVNPVG